MDPRTSIGSQNSKRAWHHLDFCLAKSMPIMGFPSHSDGKASSFNEGDLGSIPESRRSPREGNGNILQDPCLENSMDRRAWQATVHGAAKSWTRLRERDTHTHTHPYYRVVLWEHSPTCITAINKARIDLYIQLWGNVCFYKHGDVRINMKDRYQKVPPKKPYETVEIFHFSSMKHT